MVYPGAVHSRFEHSLGVYWLAGEAINKIKSYQVRICPHSLNHSHDATLLDAFLFHMPFL